MRLALITAGKLMSTVWPVTSHHSPHYCFSLGIDHTLISGHQLSPLILPCAQAAVGITPRIGPEVLPTWDQWLTKRKDCLTNSTLWFSLFTKCSQANCNFSRFFSFGKPREATNFSCLLYVFLWEVNTEGCLPKRYDALYHNVIFQFLTD